MTAPAKPVDLEVTRDLARRLIVFDMPGTGKQMLIMADEIEALRIERDNARALLDVANEVIGEVRGVCKAGDYELTVLAVRRALKEAEARGTATARAAVLRA